MRACVLYVLIAAIGGILAAHLGFRSGLFGLIVVAILCSTVTFYIYHSDDDLYNVLKCVFVLEVLHVFVTDVDFSYFIFHLFDGITYLVKHALKKYVFEAISILVGWWLSSEIKKKQHGDTV